MNDYLMNTIVPIAGVKVINGLGSYLYLDNGKKILDWFCNVGVVSLGYRNQQLEQNLKNQLHHIPNLLSYELKEHVTEELCKRTYMDKAFYCNSGTEACETAIKIIRKYMWSKNGKVKSIWTMKDGFHGRTYGAMSISSQDIHYIDGCHPLLTAIRYFTQIEDIEWDDCAGIIMETGFGNKDTLIYDNKFIKELRNKTKQNDVPLVFDEIQVGAGRTGCFNMYDHYTVVPDMVCLAKGIACGITAGVLLAKNKYADILKPGSHFSTFGGNPYSIAGIKTLLEWYTPNNMSFMYNNSQILISELNQMKHIINVRGLGLWLSFDVEKNRAQELSDLFFKNGLFAPTFKASSIKLTPPLNSTQSEIYYGIDIIKKSIIDLFGSV